MILPLLIPCNTQVLTPRDCSPLHARLSIYDRVGANDNNFSLEEGFAILRAYSEIAYLASQRETVDQAKMQIVHELLNGLITNFNEVVSYSNNITIYNLIIWCTISHNFRDTCMYRYSTSMIMLWNYCNTNGVIKIFSLFIQLSPDHCPCGSASSDSCVGIPNLSFLDLETYPSSCTPEAYISVTLAEDFRKIMLEFLMSPVRGANHSHTLTSCQQWKDNYLSPTSGIAASTLSCWSITLNGKDSLII